jgi:hypothetical protein
MRETINGDLPSLIFSIVPPLVLPRRDRDPSRPAS